MDTISPISAGPWSHRAGFALISGIGRLGWALAHPIAAQMAQDRGILSLGLGAGTSDRFRRGHAVNVGQRVRRRSENANRVFAHPNEYRERKPREGEGRRHFFELKGPDAAPAWLGWPPGHRHGASSPR